MADYLIENFIIERDTVTKQPDDSFAVQLNIYDAADTAKNTVLFRNTVMFTGDTAAFKLEVTRKVQKLIDTALNDAITEIDAALDELAAQYAN